MGQVQSVTERHRLCAREGGEDAVGEIVAAFPVGAVCLSRHVAATNCVEGRHRWRIPSPKFRGSAPDVAAILKSDGIRTTVGLLRAAKTPKQRLKIALKTGTDPRRTCSTGSPPPTACGSRASAGNMPSCLRAAGVKTVNELRFRNPQNLRRQDARSQHKRKLVRAVAVGEDGDALDRERQEAAAAHPLLNASAALPTALRRAASPRLDSPPATAQSDGLRYAVLPDGRKQWPKARPRASTHRALSRSPTARRQHVLARLLGEKAAAGHGRPQCHAGFVFRRRPVSRSASGDRAGRSALPPKAPTSSISARNRRGPMAARSRCRSRRSGSGSNRSCRPSSTLGVPVSIDTLKAARRGLGARGRRRASSTTCGACSAIPTWRASSPSTARRSSSCTIARPPIRRSTSSPTSPNSSRARSKSPGRAGIARDRIVLDPGIGFGKTPEQSIDLHRPARRLARLRPAASGRRLAQALHPFDRAVGADGAARRLARRASCSRSRTAPPSSACTTSRRRCRRLPVAAAIRQAR